VVGKSPHRRGGNPVCGGYFGANLKFAGYDALILEGKASEQVYISVINDRVEIRPAATCGQERHGNRARHQGGDGA